MHPEPLSEFLAAQRLRAGPMKRHVETFASLLAERGYAMATRKEHVLVMADLGRWLDRRHLPVGALDEARIAQFLVCRRRRGRVARSHATTLGVVLEMLRSTGAARPAPREAEKDVVPVDRATRAFAQYLSQERGLSKATLVNYVPIVRRLLSQRFDDGPIKFNALRAEDITGFIVRETRTVGPGSAKLIVTALRGWLGWLHRRGDTRTNLAGAVPAVAGWRLATLPKSIATDQVELLLDRCDRGTAVGRRDFAILMLLARLGLRAGEVVAMDLDDLDWDAGEVVVRGKGGRRDRLPLPRDVGAAVAGCSTRRIFVRAKAPRRGFANSIAICSIVERALARAGLDPPHKGAHLLRHSLACTMLRRGASLAEIGDVLRHRGPDTTVIYAKVDVGALRALAPAWPGSAGDT
jgi:site-specific recombinase XerC